MCVSIVHILDADRVFMNHVSPKGANKCSVFVQHQSDDFINAKSK